ncbi:MAG: hypothetical protein HFI93_04325 [Lachnospiraceae bacterium]|nr:hypothetical protein [Lachnospiraceae bacterium]
MNIGKIYQELAKMYGIGAEQVRQEIQKMITDAYTNPKNDNEATKACQRRIPCEGEIPTPEELIRYLVSRKGE